MPGFKARIRAAARAGGPLVLAADVALPPAQAASRIRSAVSRVAPYSCAVKLNMHALLPLGAAQIGRITAHAHGLGMQAIADIKLNDISATNAAAAGALWSMGFDALIANPVMGPASLAELSRRAHRSSHGIIALVHMSAPEARATYEIPLARGPKRLYHAFARGARDAGVDGIVVGATFAGIISECARAVPGAPVYSPGIGVQGGSARRAAEHGTEYFIVGRTLLRSPDPRAEAARIRESVA